MKSHEGGWADAKRDSPHFLTAAASTHEISNPKRFNSFQCCPRPNVDQSHQNKQLPSNKVSGATTSNVQIWKRAGFCCERQLCVSKSSVTRSGAGRSPTLIAPALRHSLRNASAIRCSCPEQRARPRRGEAGNPRSLHRLKPASTASPEERTGPRDGRQAALPCHRVLLVKCSTPLLPRSFLCFSARRGSSICRERVSPFLRSRKRSPVLAGGCRDTLRHCQLPPSKAQ